MVSGKLDNSSQFKRAAHSFQKAAPFINIAYVLIASIVMMGAAGWWLDYIFETKPLLTVFGILGGLFLGLYHLYKVVKKMEKDN
jgi:F0F1-type ATP synthase assembly protein I